MHGRFYSDAHSIDQIIKEMSLITNSKQSMRILYLHQYFTTPDKPGGTRSYDLAKWLVSAGHEVHMITSETEADTEHASWFRTEEAGIKVHWLPVPYDNHMGKYLRMKSFLSFACRCASKAASIEADVLYASSTPLTIAIPGVRAAKRQNIPLVFEVRDLWPEAPIQMGMLPGPLIPFVKRLERYAYDNSTHIVTLTPGMREHILARGIAESNVSMIPNLSNLDLFRPGIDGSEFRKRYGINDEFLLIQFGSMGPLYGLDFVLDLALELLKRNVHDVKILLIGEGKERSRLIKRVKNENISNLQIIDPLPKNQVPEGVAAADACLNTCINLPVIHTASPNKMFEALSSGKPVITNMPGWMESLVKDHNTGIFVEPDNVSDFADKIIMLKTMPAEKRDEMGKNGRQLAEKSFSVDNLAKQLELVLKDACNDFKS